MLRALILEVIGITETALIIAVILECMGKKCNHLPDSMETFVLLLFLVSHSSYQELEEGLGAR